MPKIILTKSNNAWWVMVTSLFFHLFGWPAFLSPPCIVGHHHTLSLPCAISTLSLYGSLAIPSQLTAVWVTVRSMRVVYTSLPLCLQRLQFFLFARHPSSNDIFYRTVLNQATMLYIHHVVDQTTRPCPDNLLY